MANNSSGLVANHSAGYALHLPRLARLVSAVPPELEEIPIAGLVLEVRDARGNLLMDPSGHAFVTQTDASGRFTFPNTLPATAKVLVGQLRERGAGIQIVVPAGVRQQDVDLAGFLASTYVLEKYARSQDDPEASLSRLQGDLHATALRYTAETLVVTGMPRSLDLTEAQGLIDRIRQVDGRADGVFERIRQDMVVAGQADLGSGVSALQARFAALTSVLRGPDGRVYLLDGPRGRLWVLNQGKLEALAGIGTPPQRDRDGTVAVPPSGSDARNAALGYVLDLAFDRDGRPLLLSPAYLVRRETDGTLTRLWMNDSYALSSYGPHRVHVLRDGSIVLLGTQHLVRLDQGVVAAWATLPPLRIQDPAAPLPSEQSGWVDVGQGEDLGLNLIARVFQRPAPADDAPLYRLWHLSDAAPVQLSLPVRKVLLGFTQDGGLVSTDGLGSLSIHGADGETWLDLDSGQTASWPIGMRPTNLAVLKMRVSGDRRQGFIVSDASRVALVAREGALTPLAGPWTPVPGDDTTTALGAPASVAEGPDGCLVAFDDDQGKILRLKDGVASVHAGTSWPTPEAGLGRWFAFDNVAGDPTGFSLITRAGTVSGFGGGYSAEAREAWIQSAGPLRFTPDGALWFADTHRALRRVAGGRLTTPWVSPSFDIEDYRPDPARAGRMLVLRHTSYPSTASVELWRLEPGEQPVRLVEIPRGGCCIDGGSSFVPLPDGSWFIRARGVLWTWKPGTSPRSLGPLLTDTNRGSGEFMAVSRNGKIALAQATDGARDPAAIYRVDPASGSLVLVAGPGAAVLAGDTPDTGLSRVGGLDVAGDGSLLVSDRGTGQIKRIPYESW